MDEDYSYLNKFLFWGIVLSGILYIVLTKSYIFIPSVFIPTIFVSLVAKSFFKFKKVPIFYALIVNVALWFNLLGEYYFYYHWRHYDKFLHFAVPLLIASIMYEYMLLNSKNKPQKDMIFFGVVGFSAVFEIFEYFQSGWFNFPSVGVYLDKTMVMTPYADTIWDLVFCCLGALTYLSYKTIIEHKKNDKKR